MIGQKIWFVYVYIYFVAVSNFELAFKNRILFVSIQGYG